MNPSIHSAAIILLAAAPALAQTYADGDFDPINWQSSFSANYGNGGAFTAAQDAPGNPGTKYRVHHDLNNAPPGEDSGLAVLHTFSAFSHDPATDGPIHHINALIDADKIDQNQRVRIAAIQDGVTYISTSSFTTGSLPLSGWNTVALLDLVESTFAQRFPDLTLDTGSNPDFSASGTPITFGFETSNSTGVGFNGYTTTIDFDNFSIAVFAPPLCIGDLDGDNDTDVFDFNIFAPAFGSSGLPPFTGGDLDGDGDVDVFDFNLFAPDFGCPN